MKYIVELKYTNPGHEHVSLRRRVDSITRLVEASNEQEALNRAANQQRALGFKIQEAKVVQPETPKSEPEQLDEMRGALAAAGAVRGVSALASGAARLGSAAARAVSAGLGKVASKPTTPKLPMTPQKQNSSMSVSAGDVTDNSVKINANNSTVSTGTKTNEEVEQIDERNKENKEKKDAFISKIGKDEKDRMTKSFKNMKIDKHYGAAAHARNLDAVKKTNVKTYGRNEVRDDNTPRSKNYRGSYEFSNVGEEVEQIDELKKSTLASYVNKAAHQVRAKSGIAASFETQGTRKRNPENKSAYMDVAKDFRQGAKKRLAGIEKATAKLAKEEVEQVAEGFDTDPADIAAYLVNRHGKGKVTMDHIEAYERGRDSHRPIEKHEVMKHVKKMSEEVGVDKRDAGYKMSPVVRAAQKKSDELSKVVKRPQAGTLAAVHKSMERTMERNMKKEAADPGSMRVVNKRVKAADKMIGAAKKAAVVNLEPELKITRPMV